MAFEVYGGGECRERDFGFDGAGPFAVRRGEESARARPRVQEVRARRGEGNDAAYGGFS